MSEQPASKASAEAPDIFGDKAQFRKRQGALLTLVGALSKSAKTISLYKEGHDMVGQIVGRVMATLKTAMAGEHSLTLDIKAKDVLFEEHVLEGLPELMSFAAGLHTLGIGQVSFSDRLAPEGLLEFLRMLAWKADDSVPLTELQKRVQELRIDGLTLISIVTFVATEEVSDEKPGGLSAEQVEGFCAALNLPDLVHLLYAQNEPLLSKDGQALTALIESLFDHEITLEDFGAAFPWDCYDPRIRARFEALRAEATGGGRQALCADLSFFNAGDAAALSSKPHAAEPAFSFALAQVHDILDHPAGEKQPKYAVEAYARMLEDMGKAGRIDELLQDFKKWRSTARDSQWGAYLAALREPVQKRVPSRALADAAARKLRAALDAETAETLHDFCLTIGPGLLPHLIEELRELKDKGERQQLAGLIAKLSARLGVEPIAAVLSDPDYFHVMQMVALLIEVQPKNAAALIAPLLQYDHPKVRSSAVQALRRFGGDLAADALTAFASGKKHAEELPAVVTALSLIPLTGIEQRLMRVFRANDDYDTQVAVVTALGRFPTPAVKSFLGPIASRSWNEWFTGVNKELRAAAKASLEQAARSKEAPDGP